ncbi:MAG: Hypoxia up-regulated protein 1 [Actinomycetia bacterium]|nr:Hypoxia up-regulated protein 1 [Actinomycetes bacterium]
MDGRTARTVLGVAEHASGDDIRGAFRRRALATHPDRGGDRTSFELIVLAFETLQHVTLTQRRRSVASPTAAAPTQGGFSAYDSPRRAQPQRQFADALSVAMARH